MRGAGNFAGVLGWPLDHTLSPTIHNNAFRALKLDWVYLRWPVPPHELRDAVAGLRALGAGGANVTMPHKQAIVEHLDGLTGDAEVVGAVNTVQPVGGRLVGHNTDVEGFSQFLVGDAGVATEGATALVLGAGGAARAVAKALADLGVGRVVFCARRPDAAEGLVGIATGANPGCDAKALGWDEAPEIVAGSDLIVNTTPIGMNGEDLLPEASFRSTQCVVDLIYRPPATPFVERARAAGAQAWGGLGMLVCQAAASFRIWTGQDPPLEVMSAAAVRALGHQRV